ncbi:hypothetical protein Slala02_32210 [Streptomyces lavendulae subsp. lavendulae]|nr:hypothetical protein Slala01_38080 [Streptomyces lavendulae subsp. lavendulae]GLX27401.1 hypothetical protein Slala02_32210 [Streptomyces lavendulae subsp. lavendulae]
MSTRTDGLSPAETADWKPWTGPLGPHRGHGAAERAGSLHGETERRCGGLGGNEPMPRRRFPLAAARGLPLPALRPFPGAPPQTPRLKRRRGYKRPRAAAPRRPARSAAAPEGDAEAGRQGRQAG